MEYPFEYDFYKKFIRSKIISKHNILNLYGIKPCYKVNVIFSLKKINRECILLLFWLVFVLSGKKPLLIRSFSGYKKKKIKIVVTLSIKSLLPVLKTYSVFILPNDIKKRALKLKSESSGFFFYFTGSYLEYVETFKFYDFLTTLDLNFFLENLFIVFKFFSFKGCYKGKLKTFLTFNQIVVN